MSQPTTFILACEGLYAPGGNTKKAKAQRQNVIVLAEAAGELLGPIRPHAAQVLRPLASKWRKELLHLPKMDAKRAGEYAINWAKRNGFPTPDGLTYAEEEAVAESYCIGRWALQGMTVENV